MKTLSIPAGDRNLPAWLHPCSSPASPCLVVCHGFCGSPEGGSSLELADAINKLNIATLRFSFTPHSSLSRQVTEIEAVVNFCRTNLHGPAALLGRSMGAAASLVFAASGAVLSGLILMASPADLPATFSGILGDDYARLEQGQAVTVFHEGQPVHLTPDFIKDLKKPDLFLAAASLNGLPLLVVHGMEDETVPPDHGRLLYEKAGHPKELLLLPGVSHSFSGQARHFVPQIAAWLERQVFPRFLVV